MTRTVTPGVTRATYSFTRLSDQRNIEDVFGNLDWAVRSKLTSSFISSLTLDERNAATTSRALWYGISYDIRTQRGTVLKHSWKNPPSGEGLLNIL